jgi:aryl-alcohol dehydrogenase-like predicted oxidoreductase
LVFAALVARGSDSRRKLGALEVSPVGLGCMSMAPDFYNPLMGQVAAQKLNKVIFAA